MSTEAVTPFLGAKGSKGVKIYDGTTSFKELYKVFSESAKNYRVIKFSNDGEIFVFCDGVCVVAVEVKSFKTLYEINKPKTAALQFSPCNTYLVTWEPFAAKAGSQDNYNMCIFDSKTGDCLKSLIQKQYVKPLIQWTDDESIAARKVNNEVHFFESHDFDKITNKLHMQKIQDFSLSPGSSPSHVSCHVPGSKGSPSFVRLFKYPNFEAHPSSAIANKSFFKADTVSFYWSPNGKGLLAMTSVEVDKTGSSYYGEQSLHYLGTDGESCMVQLGKTGPIYSLEWSPSSTEFAVVYGYMPAKATVYNLKCVPVFDFGTGPRNALTYNAHGNYILSVFDNFSTL
ncbi:Eukaryotic translation initiation factor 2A [Nymphon striatum]|nr:Eukaryotic translation initiation factor 2A [Nymphon striatum]